jgi:outer membrane protein
MKITQLSMAIGISLAAFAPIASADTIFGIYAGAGKWTSDYSGQAGDPAVTTQDLGISDSDNTFFYIALEHPVPLIPNIKYTHQNIQSDQTATLTKTFGLGDSTFTASTQVYSDFDLSSNDVTLYYELLDNWVNFDFGLTARQYDGYLFAEADSINEREKVDLDITIPLVYGKFQFDLPLSGLSLAVETNFMKYQENELMEYSAKIAYLFDSVLDLGLEAGYKKLSLKVDDDDTQADLDLDGPYVGAMLHF